LESKIKTVGLSPILNISGIDLVRYPDLVWLLGPVRIKGAFASRRGLFKSSKMGGLNE
jgi:hypothetical protein